MQNRAYSFLEAGGLRQMPNTFHLPVFLVRRKGDANYETQPARSIEDAVRRFVKYADVKPGTTLEALRDGQDPATEKPCTFKAAGKSRVAIK